MNTHFFHRVMEASTSSSREGITHNRLVPSSSRNSLAPYSSLVPFSSRVVTSNSTSSTARPVPSISSSLVPSSGRVVRMVVSIPSSRWSTVQCWAQRWTPIWLWTLAWATSWILQHQSSHQHNDSNWTPPTTTAAAATRASVPVTQSVDNPSGRLQEEDWY